MWIVRLALRRPYTFVVMGLTIMLLGVFAIVTTPTDIFPEIDIPVVSVIWNYQGLSTEEMAARITTYSEYTISSVVSDLRAPPAIGTMIEDFKLPDADGTEHSLNSLKGKNGAVVIFIATRCPVSNGYNERMEKLAEDYKAKGINVIGINSNNIEPAS